MTNPSAALDHVLARTHHLLLDFDGPICDFYPDDSGRAVADQLRAYLQDQGVTVPDDVATSNSPIEVLIHTATIDPDLAEKAEAKLSLTLSVILETVGASRWKIVWLPADCRRSV